MDNSVNIEIIVVYMFDDGVEMSKFKCKIYLFVEGNYELRKLFMRLRIGISYRNQCGSLLLCNYSELSTVKWHKEGVAQCNEG